MVQGRANEVEKVKKVKEVKEAEEYGKPCAMEGWLHEGQ